MVKTSVEPAYCFQFCSRSRIGADEAKEPALTDCQSAVDEAELAFVDARHIDAERIRKSRQDDGVEDQLCGTLERH